MSSKTKIVVLHMKEIIYTVIFAVLAIILILLLIFMFRPEHRSASKDNRIYTPGIYTSDITLNNTAKILPNRSTKNSHSTRSSIHLTLLTLPS